MVSTICARFLSNFGLIGEPGAVCIQQFFCVMIYDPAHDKRFWAVVAHAVVFECISFSVCYKPFLLRTFVFEVLSAFYIGVEEKRFRRRLESSRSLMVQRHPVSGQPLKASRGKK